MKEIKEMYENYKVLVKNELCTWFPFEDEDRLEIVSSKITMLCANTVVNDFLDMFESIVLDRKED